MSRPTEVPLIIKSVGPPVSGEAHCKRGSDLSYCTDHTSIARPPCRSPSPATFIFLFHSHVLKKITSGGSESVLILALSDDIAYGSRRNDNRSLCVADLISGFIFGSTIVLQDHSPSGLLICLAISTGLVIFNVTLGFGKDMSEVDPAVVPKIALTGTIFGLFAVLSAAWSKTSFALTLIRLVDGWMSWFLWFLIIATNITMDLVIVFSFVKCTPAKKVWHSNLPGTCWNPMVATYYNIFAGVPPPLQPPNATRCSALAARTGLWIELASLYGALPSVPSPSWQHPFPSCAYWYCAFTAARLIKSPIDLYALFE
ncbi:hypothetical protein DER44DRAFT_672272 [Fusarium oxysporum]|nr:hypothetical protein DER44DRAFT_672272 [Fusarium oxysporum]